VPDEAHINGATAGSFNLSEHWGFVDSGTALEMSKVKTRP